MQIDIVGAGLSGLASAISLKENNHSIKVNIFEKNKKIGYNYDGKKCGEAHTVEKEWSKWIPDKKSYYNQINKAIVKTSNKTFRFQHNKRAYILNRPEFICQLSRRAEELGVKINVNEKINKNYQLSGDYIIDASGCPSFFKKKYGINKGIKGIGYQETINNSNNFIKDTIQIWYKNEIGYFWIFPRDPIKKQINLGYAIYDYNKIKINNINLKNKLEKFKIEKSIKGEKLYEIGGMIPIGIQYPLKYKNILFVGDSGVGCFPFQGQGIYRALLSGDIAGKCIAKNKFHKYPYYIKKCFIKWDLIGKLFLKYSNKLGNLNKNLVDIAWDFMISNIPKIIH
jgi:flavin-dependent dehydrogenase